MSVAKVRNRWVLRVVDWEGGLPSGEGPAEQDVLSFNHAVWTPSAPGSDPEVQDMSLVLWAGPLLPAFIQHCVAQKPLAKVVLEMVEERGSERGLTLRYELANARVASVRPGGSAGAPERPLYELGLSFEKLTVTASELSWTSSTELIGNGG